MKYIVVILDGQEHLFVFPRTVDHDHMAEAIGMIRFGGARNWVRSYMDADIVGAGFIDNGVCHGRSETLDIKSRNERDTALLAATMPAATAASLAGAQESRPARMSSIFAAPYGVEPQMGGSDAAIREAALRASIQAQRGSHEPD